MAHVPGKAPVRYSQTRGKIRLVLEFVLVALGLIGPDVFHLISLLAAGRDVLDVSLAWLMSLALQVVGEPGENTEDLLTVLSVQIVVGVRVEVVLVLCEPRRQNFRRGSKQLRLG